MIPRVVLYSVLSSSVIAIAVGLWLWWKNKKSLLSIIFLLITISLAGFLLASYLVFKECGIDENKVIIWSRISYFLLIPFFALLYHFILILTNDVRKERATIIFGYIVAFFLMVSVWTNLFSKGVFYYRWGCSLIAQTGYHLWVIIMAIYFVLSFYHLSRYLLREKNQPNKKEAVLAVGALVLSIFLFSGILPSYQIEVYPFSFTGWWLVILIMSYIIVSYYHLRAKAVITEALIILTLVALFIQILLSESSRELIERMVFFVIIVALGQSVIKSIEMESHQAEILERAVEQRTKQLRESYDAIKKKKEELERFYELTVGRELKMAELKKEINQLKKEIEKNAMQKGAPAESQNKKSQETTGRE